MRTKILGRLLDTRRGRRWLIESLGSRVLAMTVDAGDHRMSFSPGDYIGRKVFRKGHFERERVDRLLAVLKEQGLMQADRVLLELGANIGTQTVYFALSQAFSHIVSVEPDPRNFDFLQTNIGQNGLSDQVTLLNYAAADMQGEIEFFLNKANHGKSSVLRQHPDDVVIKVAARTVPQLLELAGFPAERTGLVWMDIEGHEPAASRSMTALMEQGTPVYMEFTPLFYGQAATREFVAFLSTYYHHCIIFGDNGPERQVSVMQMPLDIDQYDVLFLPPSNAPVKEVAPFLDGGR